MSTRTRCWRISSRTPRQCSPCASSAVSSHLLSFVCTAADAMLGVGPREAGDGLGGYDNQALGFGDTQASVLSAPSSHLFSHGERWVGTVLGTFGGAMPNSGINYTVTGLAQIDDTSFASCADLVKIWTLAAA